MSSPAQLPANSINSASKSIRKLDFTFLPIPKNRRLDPLQQPEEQFAFTWRMNLVFATAATVSIMNLYSIQPMLARISSDLSVSDEVVSRVPTLIQGGYGCGTLFITPLGDLVRRRQLVLLLVFLSTTLSIGSALARNVRMLEGFSFLVGPLTVTPQIVILWTADGGSGAFHKESKSNVDHNVRYAIRTGARSCPSRNHLDLRLMAGYFPAGGRTPNGNDGSTLADSP